jgi:serine/threonine protein kinase
VIDVSACGQQPVGIEWDPVFMAPEQRRGEDATEQSDLFTLGVILYRLLSGRLPFDADDPNRAIVPLVGPATSLRRYAWPCSRIARDSPRREASWRRLQGSRHRYAVAIERNLHGIALEVTLPA